MSTDTLYSAAVTTDRRPGPQPAALRRPFAVVPADAVQLAVPMRDGVRLATDVYLPDDSAGPWPTLICRLPYDKAGSECFLPQVARWFTARAYAMVVQDVRGKVRSDGDVVPFRAEVDDGYDTIDWVVGQAWSDGRVGMVGDSYCGFTQWAAAASGHPALRAITPRVTTPDFTDVLNRQGVFPLEMACDWALETWVDENLYDYDGQLDWDIRPPSHIVAELLAGRRIAVLDQWARGDIDEAARLSVSDVPALHLGGFFDFMQREQIAAWQQAVAQGFEDQYLLLDSVDHGWTELRAPGDHFDDPQGGKAAMARFLDRYLTPLHAFLDAFLLDGPKYEAPRVRWHLTHAGWQEDSDWPPAAAVPRSWFLALGDGVDGRLADAADGEVQEKAWMHDPHDPVPSLVHPYYPLIAPVDDAPLGARADVLTYTTDPLAHDVDLAGPCTVTVPLLSTAASMDLIATLHDVAPDGSAHRILDGAARGHGPWPQDVMVDLGHTGYRVQQGHRLRVRLASSSYPQYLIHPGTDEDPWTATHTMRAENSVLLGGPSSAALTCHVLPSQRGTT